MSFVDFILIKEENMDIVCIAWATNKRHIVINNNILCESKHKTSGYCISNHQYNSLSLSGFPDYVKENDDIDYGKAGTHSDGLIEFKPLNQQKVKIIERSICKKCLKKYNSFFNNR